MRHHGLVMLGFGLSLLGGCAYTAGTPLDVSELGYTPCDGPYACGAGRYCNEQGYCAADCRSSADCALLGEGMVCTLYGQCRQPDGAHACTSHADCGENRYCNGACRRSGSACGSTVDCPWHELDPEDVCEGFCGAFCGKDDDCRAFGDNLECTPAAQCLKPGWEKWIPAGELPPTECVWDPQCKTLGWAFVCDCPKETDPRTGRPVCQGGARSRCVKDDAPLDFGAGPAASPAHAFRGVWGMRMEIGVVSVGVPLVNRQNTYSSNLFLVRIDHRAGDTLEITETLCQLNLINFAEDDRPFTDLAWMVIPYRYLRALPLLSRQVTLSSSAAGAPWETTRSLEVRGALLSNPESDPLPTRHDYARDPADARIWDQDGDGHPGMTTLMDGVLRGEIYNDQRWAATYHGQILDTDHVRGLAEIQNEQLILSAGSPNLIYDTSTEIHPQADRTYFRLMRLADDASCATLIREAARESSWLRHTPHLMDVPDP